MPVDHAHGQGRADRRTEEATLLGAGPGLQRTMGDRRATQLGAAEDGVEAVEQGLVGPPAYVEPPARGAGGGLQVGVHVAAAEGVDGLLGIADEHESAGRLAEGGPQDAPLHRVGVLELVDDGH